MRYLRFPPCHASLWAAATAVFLPLQGVAQDMCGQDAVVVFDGSGSMAEMGYNRLDLPRIFEARHAIRVVAPRVAPLRRIGLVVYGPGPGESCASVDLRFAPQPDAAGRLIAEIDALQPSGETPLTDAVAQAAALVGAGGKPGTVVLVTDGKETCGGNPCLLAAELAADNPALTVHVIGFKVRGEHFAYDGTIGEQDYENAETVAACLADRTGGTYVTAETVDDLIAALQQTLGCAVIGQRASAVRPRG